MSSPPAGPCARRHAEQSSVAADRRGSHPGRERRSRGLQFSSKKI
jgi:hypothetical protein